MAKSKKSSKRDQVARLADPVTYAAMDAALKAGDAIFGAPMEVVFEKIKALTADRHPRTLTGQDAVQLMALKAEFDGLSVKQAQFVEADLARRLDPDDDAGGTGVRPRLPSDLSHA